MNTVAIDSNMLNGLFDNQKKLDELFDSIFDDENYFINSSSTSYQTERRRPAADAERTFSVRGDNMRESSLAMKRNPLSYILPIVLEIAVIYLLATNIL